MGDWSNPIFIASQVLMIIAYLFLGCTYFQKKRLSILIFVIIANLVRGASFGLLTAWIAVGTSAIAVARDTTNLAFEKFRSAESKSKTKWFDWALLGLWLTALLLVSIFTANNIWLWFSFFAMATITVQVWQKSVLIYIILGLITPIFWIVFNFYIENLFGIIAESIMWVITLIGLILFLYRKKKSHAISKSATV